MKKGRKEVKQEAKYKKLSSNQKKPRVTEDCESPDCKCFICSSLYSGDTTANEWVQECEIWAQVGCNKGAASFT